MSERMRVRIRYDVMYSPPHVEKVIQAVSQATSASWHDLRDQWSSPKPDHAVDIEEWTANTAPETMTWFAESNAAGYWATKEFSFSFSPLSRWTSSLFIKREADGFLTVLLAIPAAVMHEYAGEREQTRMEWEWDEIREQRGEDSTGKRGPDTDYPSYDQWWDRWNELADTAEVWPQNKKCLQQLIEKLRSALPVRELSIDDRLSKGVET